MERHALSYTFLPELGSPYRGKVREVYDRNDTLAIIASDRISVFDRVLSEPIRDKGHVLTKLSLFWFDRTKDIISNHLVSNPDANVMIVKKCKPILLEVIVRAYLAGSLWRDYQSGKRTKCGVNLPEGLQQNDPLPDLIVTPTTKSMHGHDEDITKENAIEQGLVTRELWNEIEFTALSLFKRGQEILKQKGLILVDTKYEFGLDANNRLVLIDEIHTPDSSRFWFTKDYNLKEIKFPDKEFAREWMRSHGFTGNGPAPSLPKEIQEKIRKGYQDVYQTITGESLEESYEPINTRLLLNLKKAQIIHGLFALLLAGSEKDMTHVEKITEVLKEHGIPFKTIIASAHKHPSQVLEIIEQYNQSLEPIVCITIAGRSNALSGVVAANIKWPVIACPPFKDYSDYLTNIHSSLQMPSKVPVLTVVDPGNAGLAAVRILKTMEMMS